MAEWAGVREFARGRGVSAPYISQLIAAGRIHKVDGKINVAQANAVLDAVRVKADGKRAAAQAAAAPAAAPDKRETAGGATSAYTNARAVRETSLAKMAQLEYRQRVGELGEVEAFKRGVVDAFAPMVRELRGLPARICGRSAAETDTRKNRDLLAAEIERTLARIAEVVAALPGSIGKTRQ